MNLNNRIKEKMKSCKTNYANKLIYCGIASLVLIIVAVIFLCSFNFNYSFSYTGGFTANVKVGATLDDNQKYQEITNKIDGILRFNGTKIDSSYKVSSGTDAALVINYKAISDAGEGEMTQINDRIVDQIKDALVETDPELEIVLNKVLPNSISAQSVNALWVFAVAAVVATVYVAIRHKLMFSLIMLISVLHDLLLTIALVVVIRVPVGYWFFGVLGVTMLLTTMIGLININKIKENRTKLNLKGASNGEIVNISLKENAYINILISVLAVICLFTLSAMGVTEFYAVLVVLLSVLVVLYSQYFIICPLWSELIKKNGYDTYVKQPKVVETKESEVEIIEQ